MKIFCNPLNLPYQYQFCKNRDGHISANREAADPSMVLFKGLYYIFASMTCGFYYSEDLVNWKFHALKDMPVYDYAPDVRPVGDWLYFCASSHEKGTHYRTRDPFSDEYEKINGAFPFWDPNLFEDEDGRLYFYWGSSPREPIWGVKLDRETLQPIGERVPLFQNDEDKIGYERRGEDHVPARSAEEKQKMLAGIEQQDIDPMRKQMAIDYITDHGYIEGAWMTKHAGRYYLQYGAAGAQFNIYGDGVYVSDNPLGPFALAKNNPYSYKPGGFLPGAGHGSTMEDKDGAWWHISTMRISVNHVFERRLGLWSAGFDADGELFCSQRYGDWPQDLDKLRRDPLAEPDWMLLSYGKKVAASSFVPGCEPDRAADENVRTWWKPETNKPGEWLTLDLGAEYDVHAIQINYADDHPAILPPEGTVYTGDIYDSRWIDTVHQPTRWLLKGSLNGEDWFVIEDKSETDSDLPHDLIVREQGFSCRYVKLTVVSVPYGQIPCVSGLRVFGLGHGEKPAKAQLVTAEYRGDLDVSVSWHGEAIGYVLNWGHAPDKLYHSRMCFEPKAPIGALIKGQNLFIRVDIFNENGITEGEIIHVKETTA